MLMARKSPSLGERDLVDNLRRTNPAAYPQPPHYPSTTFVACSDTEHTYNVLDADAKYAERANDLAKEFSGTDEATEIDRPDTAATGPMVRGIVQAWLLRDTAETRLDQAHHSLRFTSTGQERSYKESNDDGHLTVSELARSLHTDRPQPHPNDQGRTERPQHQGSLQPHRRPKTTSHLGLLWVNRSSLTTRR